MYNEEQDTCVFHDISTLSPQKHVKLFSIFILIGNSQELSHTLLHSRKLAAGSAVGVAAKVVATQARVGKVMMVAKGVDIVHTSCLIFKLNLELVKDSGVRMGIACCLRAIFVD